MKPGHAKRRIGDSIDAEGDRKTQNVRIGLAICESNLTQFLDPFDRLGFTSCYYNNSQDLCTYFHCKSIPYSLQGLLVLSLIQPAVLAIMRGVMKKNYLYNQS
jgi:hypothetical protein